MPIVSGTLLDDAGAIYNVKNPDFAGGAKGDGTTDDFAAITAAIAAATSAPHTTGGVVYFPPGIYIISQALLGQPKKCNVLVGANRDSTIIKHQTGGKVLEWQTVGFGHFASEDSCRIEELTCDGNNGVNVVVVDIANLTLLRMSRVNVFSNGASGAPVASIGLRLTSMFDSHFDGIYVASCGGPGAFLPCVLLDTNTTTGAEFNNCQFYNLHIEPGQTDAILLNLFGNSQSLIQGNYFYGLKTHGHPPTGQPNNTVVQLSQYARGNSFFGHIVAYGNSTTKGQVECDGQRNVWYSPRVGGNIDAPPASAFHFTQHAANNVVCCADVASSFGTAPFLADPGSVHNKLLFPSPIASPPLQDGSHNLVWWDDTGSILGVSLQNVGGISSTTTPAKHLAGSVQITGGNSSATVTFPLPGEPDTNYRLVVGLSGTSGSPAAAAKTIANVSKTTLGFTLTLGGAPSGTASVTYDWIIARG
jgi:hypothetical protein